MRPFCVPRLFWSFFDRVWCRNILVIYALSLLLLIFTTLDNRHVLKLALQLQQFFLLIALEVARRFCSGSSLAPPYD